MNAPKHPRVFISYSHESPQHTERVRVLAGHLRTDGCDCSLDLYEPHPAEGWPRWIDTQVDTADFVLVVCTADYYRKSQGRGLPRTGRGVQFEAVLIIDELYAAGMLNERFIPVLYEDLDEELIPRPLRSYTRYRLDQPGGYEVLLRHLTDQPLYPPPPLGRVPDLPSERPPAGDPYPPSRPSRESGRSVDYLLLRATFVAPGSFGPSREIREISTALESIVGDMQNVGASLRDYDPLKKILDDLRLYRFFESVWIPSLIHGDNTLHSELADIIESLRQRDLTRKVNEAVAELRRDLDRSVSRYRTAIRLFESLEQSVRSSANAEAMLDPALAQHLLPFGLDQAIRSRQLRPPRTLQAISVPATHSPSLFVSAPVFWLRM